MPIKHTSDLIGLDGSADDAATDAATDAAAPAADATAGTGETSTATAGKAARVVELDGERFEVPPDLWDEATGSINPTRAAKRALDLRKQLSARGEVPETYELHVPDNMADRVEIDDEHPLAMAFREIAAKHKGIATQGMFDELVATYLETEVAEQNDWQKQQAEREQVERAAVTEFFGGEAAAKVQAQQLRDWLTAQTVDATGQPDMELLTAAKTAAGSAAGVRLLHRLMGAAKEPPMVARRTAPTQAPISEADLKAKMNDPRYWRDHDPVLIQEVTDGYARLYAGDSV